MVDTINTGDLSILVSILDAHDGRWHECRAVSPQTHLGDEGESCILTAKFLRDLGDSRHVDTTPILQPSSSLYRQDMFMCRDAFRVPPWPIYRFGVWLLSSLHITKRALEPPPSTIFDMVRGAWRSQVTLPTDRSFCCSCPWHAIKKQEPILHALQFSPEGSLSLDPAVPRIKGKKP